MSERDKDIVINRYKNENRNQNINENLDVSQSEYRNIDFDI